MCKSTPLSGLSFQSDKVEENGAWTPDLLRCRYGIFTIPVLYLKPG